MTALLNLYYKRVRPPCQPNLVTAPHHAYQTAATAKACYICYKPTVTVLATIDTADFFYTCPIHLTDPGFATRAPDPDPDPKKPAVSAEEIAKVKQEREEKQQQKKDKAQEKKEDGGENVADKEVEGKDADAGAKADASQEKKPANAVSPAPSTSPSETPAPRSTHERYVLHRSIFALRTADHRRRRQAAQTKSLAPRLPGTPSGLP